MKKYWELFTLAIVIAAIGIAFTSIQNYKQVSCTSPLAADANRDGAVTYKDIGITALQIVSMPAKYMAATPILAPAVKFLELDVSDCKSLRTKILSSAIALGTTFLLAYFASFFFYGLRNALKLIAFFAMEYVPSLKTILNKRTIRNPRFEWILRPTLVLLLVVGLSTISISTELKAKKPRTSAATSQKALKNVDETEPSNFDKSNMQYKNIYAANLSALKQLDSRVATISTEDAKSVETLTKALVKGLDSDLEKTYAIYRWVTTNIEYDVDAFFSKRLRGIGSAPVVLRNRKAVCDGYSELMLKMAQSAGIKIKKIQGFAKGYGYAIGDSVNKPNHAWNAVQIDGTWYLLDSTWDAGSVSKETRRFTPNKSDYKYFLSNPSSFIHSHYPEQRKWQLLENEWSREEFSRQPFNN